MVLMFEIPNPKPLATMAALKRDLGRAFRNATPATGVAEYGKKVVGAMWHVQHARVVIHQVRRGKFGAADKRVVGSDHHVGGQDAQRPELDVARQ